MAFADEKYPWEPRGIKEVRVLSSDINTHYWINLYEKTAYEFFQFVLANRKGVYSTNKMPGVAGPATLALERLFCNLPTRFPLVDLIRYLRDEQRTFCGGVMPNPTITFEELEDALIRWYCKGETVDSPTEHPDPATT